VNKGREEVAAERKKRIVDFALRVAFGQGFVEPYREGAVATASPQAATASPQAEPPSAAPPRKRSRKNNQREV